MTPPRVPGADRVPAASSVMGTIALPAEPAKSSPATRACAATTPCKGTGVGAVPPDMKATVKIAGGGTAVKTVSVILVSRMVEPCAAHSFNYLLQKHGIQPKHLSKTLNCNYNSKLIELSVI